jgi:hypothetical protein
VLLDTHFDLDPLPNLPCSQRYLRALGQLLMIKRKSFLLSLLAMALKEGSYSGFQKDHPKKNNQDGVSKFME